MKYVYRSHASYQEAQLNIFYYKYTEGNRLIREVNSGMIKETYLTLFGEIMTILRAQSGKLPYYFDIRNFRVQKF